MSINSLIVRPAKIKGSVSTQQSNMRVTVRRNRINVDADVMHALSKDELMLYLLLDEMSATNQEITPDQSRIAKILGTTQSTVSRRLKNLRIMRMVALKQKDNTKKTWKQRQSYILFDRPADVRTVLSVDQSYLVFLVEGTETGSQRVRQLCKAELKSIPKQVLLTYEIYLDLDDKSPKTSANEKLDIVEYSSYASVHNVGKQDMHSYASVHNVGKQDMHSYASVHNVGKIKGYIYTRACAPAQSSIKSYGFNDNHTLQGWGCGGRDFDFFENIPIRKLLEALKSKYRNRTAHAILNKLKQKKYEVNGKSFTHTIREDEAEIILTALIVNQIRAPLKYTEKLIYKASIHELTFLNGHQEHFMQLTGLASTRKTQSIKPAIDEIKDKKLSEIVLVDGMELIGKASGKSYFYQENYGGLEADKQKVDKSDGFSRFTGFIDDDELKELIIAGKLSIKGGNDA